MRYHDLFELPFLVDAPGESNLFDCPECGKLEVWKNGQCPKCKKAAGELVGYLSVPSGEQRLRACKILAMYGDKGAIKPLIGMLSDRQPVTRDHAAFGLGRLHATTAVDRLLQLLQKDDEYVEVRANCAGALGKIGDKKAVPALIRSLSDLSTELESAADIALNALGLRNPSMLRLVAEKPQAIPSVGVSSSIEGYVINEGSGPAFTVSLTFSEPTPVSPQRIDISDEIPARSGRVHWQTSFAPQASGALPISWQLTFDDRSGIGQTVSGEENIQVSEAERSSTNVSIGSLYEGPVDQRQTTVQGDLLEDGAVKQSEGVILQKRTPGEVSKNFGFCPHCGDRLDLPNSPRFCPYCGETLSVS